MRIERTAAGEHKLGVRRVVAVTSAKPRHGQAARFLADLKYSDELPELRAREELLNSPIAKTLPRDEVTKLEDEIIGAAGSIFDVTKVSDFENVVRSEIQRRSLRHIVTQPQIVDLIGIKLDFPLIPSAPQPAGRRPPTPFRALIDVDMVMEEGKWRCDKYGSVISRSP